MKDGFIPPHGGYENLLSFKKSRIVYDATVYFCGRYIDKYSRTHDQMVQAARSGKQNILEVAVNNDYGSNKVPFGSSFDWPNDGGIIRPVALIVLYPHATLDGSQGLCCQQSSNHSIIPYQQNCLK